MAWIQDAIRGLSTVATTPSEPLLSKKVPTHHWGWWMVGARATIRDTNCFIIGTDPIYTDRDLCCFMGILAWLATNLSVTPPPQLLSCAFV